MIDFNNFSPEELTLLAQAVSLALSEGKSTAYLNVLGNFISTVGVAISTIASQREYLEGLLKEDQNDI